MNISSQYQPRPQDYRFERVRQDRLYVPLEKTPATFKAWRWDIVAALTVVALGYVAFPVAAWLAEIVATFPW